MAEFSVSVRSSTLTINTSSVELRAVTALRLVEFGVTVGTATASTFGLGRPANSGSVAGGTANVGQANEVGITTTSGLIITGWTTAPTAPANYMRRLQTAAVGAGAIWTFPRPIVVPAGGSLVLYNITAVVAADIYAVFDD